MNGHDDPQVNSPDAQLTPPLAPFGKAVYEAVTKGLDELFATPDVTNQRFEEVVARHPVLLTSEGLGTIQGLASSQSDKGAREALERLHDILARATEVGVETATAEFRIDTTPEERSKRLERERKQLRASRSHLPVKEPHGPSGIMLAKGTAFDSLSECRAYIISTYPQATIPVVGKDIDSYSDQESKDIQWQAPKFLFRGESGLFPTTQTSLTRLRSDLDLSIESIETLIALSIRIRSRLSDQLDMSPRVANAFLQHYGAPTHFFDFSPDLDIAVGFATNLSPGDWGAIAVLPVERLTEDPQSIMLADLTRHKLAYRPRRQHAYAYLDRKYVDLKDPQAISDRKIAWHWFRFTAEDEELQSPDPSLLDAYSDPVAGLIELFINDAARFDDSAARWLSQRVPAAPTLLRILSRTADGVEVAMIPAEDAGPQLVENSASSNYRRWSTAFTTPRVGPKPEDIGTVTSLDPNDLTPGATVLVLRPDVLQLPRSKRED
jgi:hypothetical protein